MEYGCHNVYDETPAQMHGDLHHVGLAVVVVVLVVVDAEMTDNYAYILYFPNVLSSFYSTKAD